MTERANFPLLPYSYVVGQEEFRRLLEIAYVMGPGGGGVLVSGERGTAKSTIARSFTYTLDEQLPMMTWRSAVSAAIDGISGAS